MTRPRTPPVFEDRHSCMRNVPGKPRRALDIRGVGVYREKSLRRRRVQRFPRTELTRHPLHLLARRRTTVIENPYYTTEFHGDYEVISIGRLDCRRTGPCDRLPARGRDLRYLNEAKNAILIPTWYSGTHQIWRDVYIGEGHALDPRAVLHRRGIDQIGSGLSTSPHNADGANASHRDVEVPAGAHRRRRGRPGAAPARALRHRAAGPGHRRVDGRAADLRVGGPLPRQGLARRADRRHRAEHPARLPARPGPARGHPLRPGIANGEYASNDRRRRRAHPARPSGGRGWASPTRVLEAGGLAGTGLRLPGGLPRRVLFEPYFTAMDPERPAHSSWKWQRGDVARHTGGDLAAALGRITAKTFVMPIDEDMFFPVRDCAPGAGT